MNISNSHFTHSDKKKQAVDSCSVESDINKCTPDMC